MHKQYRRMTNESLDELRMLDDKQLYAGSELESIRKFKEMI